MRFIYSNVYNNVDNNSTLYLFIESSKLYVWDFWIVSHWNRNYCTFAMAKRWKMYLNKTIIEISQNMEWKFCDGMKVGRGNIARHTMRMAKKFIWKMFCAQFERKYGKEDFTFLALESEKVFYFNWKWLAAVLPRLRQRREQRKKYNGEKFRWKLQTNFCRIHNQKYTYFFLLMAERQLRHSLHWFRCVRQTQDEQKKIAYLFCCWRLQYTAFVFFSSLNFRLSFLYFGLLLCVSFFLLHSVSRFFLW